MSSASSHKLSFTIRRPTPPESRGLSPGASDSAPNFRIPALPRHLSGPSNDSPLGSPLSRSATSSPKHIQPRSYDSSDEDEELQDELVTGFDKFGVERANGRTRKAPDAPLVIPALKNKDWRALARKRRGGAHFVPESGKAGTGADGSAGGLGIRDSINSGPVLSGLQVRKTGLAAKADASNGDILMEEEGMKEVGETEEQAALRALLAEANGTAQDDFVIQPIPTPVSEAEAFKQDIDELPDGATLDDYERVPVSQFGAAMLRGMGWRDGMAASRKPGKGMVDPYLPPSRPALLGIGAKEQEVLDIGSKAKRRIPAAKYVPVAKVDRVTPRERSRSPIRSSTVSRRPSRSPDRRTKEKRSRDDSYRHREQDLDRSGPRDYEERDRFRESEQAGGREGNYHKDYDRDDKDRRRQSSSSYYRSESSRGSSRRRDY